MGRGSGVFIRARYSASKFLAALILALTVVSAPGRPVHAADYGANPEAYAEGVVDDTAYGEVQRVKLTINKSRTFTIARAFSKVTVGNSEIADALPLSDRGLYLQGKSTGTTNVSMFDASGQLISIIDVEVVPDLGNLREKIRESAGGGNINVSSAGGQIVLTGVAEDAVMAERTLAITRAIYGNAVVNAMQVAPSQQVMLEVRFIEASRSAARELGVNLFAANRRGDRGVNTGQPGGGDSPVLLDPRGFDPRRALPLDPPRTKLPGGNLGDLPIIQGVATLFNGLGATNPYITILTQLVGYNGTSIDALITALEEKGLVRRLAEPNLVALSGDTARFHAGGEFPVPVPTATTGGIPTITIEYKKFGVELSFTPTVLSRGTVDLRVFPSVSELDFANAVTISGFSVPALTVREAETRVELRDGQSFAIAGLLQHENRRQISQVPWVGSVPVLGTLFRSSQYLKKETDLVVIVTPRLVRPAVPGQRLATPLDSRLPSNDVDFFLNGQPEVKKQYNSFATAGGRGPYGHLLWPESGVTKIVPAPLEIKPELSK
jgi:pilus assembly protein CpaC